MENIVARKENKPSWEQALLEILSGEPENYAPRAALNRLIRLSAIYLNVDAVFVTSWESQYGLAKTVAAYLDPALDQQNYPQVDEIYDFYGRYGKTPFWYENHTPLTIDSVSVVPGTVEQQYLQQFGVRCVLFMPLIVSGHVTGTLEIWRIKSVNHFDLETIRFCQGLLPTIISTMHHLEIYHAESQRRIEAETFNEIAQLLSGTMDLDEIFHEATSALRVYLVNIHNFSISIIEEGIYLRNRYNWQENDSPVIVKLNERVLIQDTIPSKLVLESREPFAISDLQTIPLLNERTQKLIESGLRSVLYVPLKFKNEVFGLIHINVWNEPRVFTPDEISLAQGVATQVAIAVANSRLFDEKNKQLLLSQTLQKVGALLMASLSLREVYQKIFDLLADVVAYDSVSLFLFDDMTGKFTIGDARGMADIKPMEKIAGKLTPHIMEKIPIPPGWRVIPNIADYDGWIEIGEVPSPGSWIGAALIVKGRLIGVLNVDSKQPYRYDQDMGKTVAVFASQAAIAIENARLYDAILQQTSELSVLHQVALATATTLDVDVLLQQTTEMIVDRLYTEMFGFLLVNGEEKYVYPHLSYYGIDQEMFGKKLLFSESICGWVALYKEPTIISDTRDEPLFVAGMAGSRSEVAVPVLIGDECVAVINVESTRPNAFKNQDVYFLTTLARNVAAAIEKANLYEALLDQADNLAKQVTIQTHSLELERDRMLAILDNVGDGIIFTNTTQTILFVNPAFLTLSGYQLDDIEGQQLELFAQSSGDRQVLGQMWRALKNKRRWSGELVYKRYDGSAFDVNISATPSTDKADRVHGYVIVHADISHFKEVERLKSGFISNISHELRTPLTNINTYLALLERGLEEKRDAYFTTLYQQSEKLNRLIQDLIDISRLDARLSPELVGRTNLFDLLGVFWQRYDSKARQHNLEIQQHYETDYLIALPAVRLRFEDAEFILTKIFENAFSFSPENGKIVITIGEQVAEEKSFVWFGLEDDGPGIPDDEIKLIFNRFFRGKAAQELNIPGTGLGLALAQELLVRQGGWIEAKQTVHGGTLFRTFMPSE